jgi:hypothetical protein
MNPTPTRSQNRAPGRATSTETIRHHVEATDREPDVQSSKQPRRQRMKALTPVVHQVVDGFIDSLKSDGEGVLPIVLALQPGLSTIGILESDAEFARRGRRQSAAERRFFRTIEATLRDALERILDGAARAAMRRRKSKERKNLMAAGAEPHLERHTCVNLVPLAAPRNDGPGPDNLSLHSAASRHPSTPSMPAEE